MIIFASRLANTAHNDWARNKKIELMRWSNGGIFICVINSLANFYLPISIVWIFHSYDYNRLMPVIGAHSTTNNNRHRHIKDHKHNAMPLSIGLDRQYLLPRSVQCLPRRCIRTFGNRIISIWGSSYNGENGDERCEPMNKLLWILVWFNAFYLSFFISVIRSKRANYSMPSLFTRIQRAQRSDLASR